MRETGENTRDRANQEAPEGREKESTGPPDRVEGGKTVARISQSWPVVNS